jgi:hypothetical protein
MMLERHRGVAYHSRLALTEGPPGSRHHTDVAPPPSCCVAWAHKASTCESCAWRIFMNASPVGTEERPRPGGQGWACASPRLSRRPTFSRRRKLLRDAEGRRRAAYVSWDHIATTTTKKKMRNSKKFDGRRHVRSQSSLVILQKPSSEFEGRQFTFTVGIPPRRAASKSTTSTSASSLSRSG